MKQDDRPESRQTVRVARPLRRWLLGVVIALLLLLMAAPLITPYFIDSAAVKRQIQAAVSEQIGGQFDYQAIDFLFFPRPAIELHQVKLVIPDRIQGQVDTLLLVPKLFPLLSGDLHLAAIELTAPQFNLDLPPTAETNVSQRPPEQFAPAMALIAILEPLQRVTPTLKLVISGGRLTFHQGGRELVELNGLELKVGLLVSVAETTQASLEGALAGLTLHRKGRVETLRNATLECSVMLAQDDLTLKLDRLTLAEPALALEGELVLTRNGAGNALKLTGRGLDVDAARRVALNLAGDHPVAAGIFRYLRGGRVPQISVHAQAATPGELGSLPNLRIAGQLQGGAVSIPELELDLAEVNGDVTVADGILQGSGLSARLEGATGHAGSLKVGLGAARDLFQLQLTLSADLAQARQVLQRIVANPDFSDVLGKITDLKGRGSGTLVLGDSLDSLKARLDVTEFNLSAGYQGVPLPMVISQGQLSFTEQRIDIKTLNGSLGRSEFSTVAGSIAWQKTLELDLRAGPTVLDLDELYPWLAAQDRLKEALEEIHRLSGRLELQSLQVTGALDQPGAWQLAAAGALRELLIESPRLPFAASLAEGDFKLESGTLAFQSVKLAGLDADLVMSGNLQGFPQQITPLELSLDGTLGAGAVAWLRGAFNLPDAYTLRTPLSLSGTKVLWSADATTALTGNLTVLQGPELSFDLIYRPEHLHINLLTIRDQASDARLGYKLDQDELNLNFSGTLRHETLTALFVDPLVGQGQVSGEISIKSPKGDETGVVANGHLRGENLAFPLSSGRLIAVEQLDLEASGSRVDAHTTSFTWGDLTWRPLNAEINFQEDRTLVKINQAMLCGIDSPGLVTLAGQQVALDLTLAGKGLDVATSYNCLTKGKVKMTGSLDFTSQLTASGEPRELVGSLRGPLEMTFTKGVIKQDKLLARLLEVLNVTEIIKGRLPDLGSKGFAYTSIIVQGEFKKSKLVIDKLEMDGETLDILGYGKIDLEQQTINVELLAAPLKTADTIIKNIPGVNYLLAGTLVTIPVSVKGDLYDPKISVMSASSVGTSLLNLGERTLKAPIKLIETILPGKKETKE